MKRKFRRDHRFAVLNTISIVKGEEKHKKGTEKHEREKERQAFKKKLEVAVLHKLIFCLGSNRRRERAGTKECVCVCMFEDKRKDLNRTAADYRSVQMDRDAKRRPSLNEKPSIHTGFN